MTTERYTIIIGWLFVIAGNTTNADYLKLPLYTLAIICFLYAIVLVLFRKKES